MTKKWKTILIIIIYLLIAFIISYQNYKKDKEIQKNIQDQLSGNISFTWNIFSWYDINIETWAIDSINPSEYENFKNLLNSNNFIRKFNPPRQPIIYSSMTYEEKSSILNEYLKDNNFYFRNAEKLKDWYLYIKLNKELNNWDVFLYFHDTKENWYTVSGKLRKNLNLIGDNSKEFLYKLDSIDIRKFYGGNTLDYDRLSNELNITNKLHYIWWYTTSSDGNFIEEIIIVWK